MRKYRIINNFGNKRKNTVLRLLCVAAAGVTPGTSAGRDEAWNVAAGRVLASVHSNLKGVNQLFEKCHVHAILNIK